MLFVVDEQDDAHGLADLGELLQGGFVYWEAEEDLLAAAASAVAVGSSALSADYLPHLIQQAFRY